MFRTMLPAFLLSIAMMIAPNFELLSTTDGTTDDSDDSISVLEERINALRKSGNYEEALEIAKQYFSVIKSNRAAYPFQIRDAERSIQTLEFILSLSSKDQQELAEASRMADIMDSLYSNKEYAKAAAIAEKQLETQRRILGEENREVAQSLNNLSGLITYLGDYERARTLSREALEIRRSILGEEHPETLESLLDMAGSLQAQSDFARAESLLTEILEIQQRMYGGEHQAIARTLYEMGDLKEKTGDHNGALSLYEKSLEMQRRIFGAEHADIASNLQAIGGIYKHRGEYAIADSIYRDALSMRRKFLGNDHPFVAALLNDLGGVLWYTGDYPGAESLLRQALDIRRNHMGEDHIAIAYNLNNIAHVVLVQGKHEEAQRLTEEALRILKKNYGDEHEDIAWTLGTLATIVKLRGDYENAGPLFREALAMQKKLLGEEAYAYSVTLCNYAGLLNEQGDNLGAELLSRKSLALSQKLLGKEHPDVATDMNNLASLLKKQGDYSAALEMYQEALAIYQKTLGTDHPHIATCLSNIAKLHEDQGAYAAAERLYREARAILLGVYGNEHQTVAANLSDIADVLHLKGEYAAADSLYRDALSLWSRVGEEEHPEHAAILKSYAKLLRTLGHRREAELKLMQVIAIRENLMGKMHPYLVSDCNDAALFRWEDGDYQSAEMFFSKSAAIFEVARLRAGIGLRRATFQTSPYPGLAAIHLLSGRSNNAWSDVEMHQGRILSELLFLTDQRKLQKREIAQEDSLRKALNAIESELKAYRKAAPTDTTGEMQQRAEKAYDRLLATELKWSELQQAITELYPVAEGHAFSLERIQKSISKETALIGWLDVNCGADKYASWGYVMRNRGSVKWARIHCPSEGETNAYPCTRPQAFRRSLSWAGSSMLNVKRDARELWKQRIAPLTQLLQGIKYLVVIPSGMMVGVPVEALEDEEGTSLSDRYIISYVPSATIHAWLAERSENRRRGIPRHTLLVGDPAFSGTQLAAMQAKFEASKEIGEAMETPLEAELFRAAIAGNEEALASLPRLTGSKQEVMEIAGMAPGATVLLDTNATEQELVRLAESDSLKEYSTIHIATHALVDDERMEQSALVLSQTNLPDPITAAMEGTHIYDGLVTAKEIMREWRLNAYLVSLSACETGLGRKIGGEGYVGFSHAFFQAGARSLLVSLWKVDDRATSLLMKRFYENYFGKYLDKRLGMRNKPMSNAEALKEAKSWLRSYTDKEGRRIYEHPYYWSSFILIGKNN